MTQQEIYYIMVMPRNWQQLAEAHFYLETDRGHWWFPDIKAD